MGKAVIIGESLIDIVRTPDGQQREYPGGSPMNVAIGLARLGRATELVTWLGTDARGQAILEHLQESGVELVPGATGAPRTSTALAQLDDAGHAEYVFDLLWEVPPLPARDTVLVAHTGSMSAVLGAAPDAESWPVFEMLAQLRDAATITYDPNIRPDVMGTPAQVIHLVEQLVGITDVVKVSDEDLAWLYPEVPPVDSARAWAQGAGPSLVVLTQGAAGSLGLTADGREIAIPADPTVVVADTVGAGDSFMSGLLHALWREDLLGAVHRLELASLPTELLSSILSLAARIADITVSRPGADPPWLSQV
ncbi:MAG: PfkB family carbohydrate kinase [Propionibacteriaceae bacterium]|jgi:fructokinase|nr:PfkB family carbohydrate kinase [Propionibacteriaceae bacterium]